jgi:hypothetical protein
MWSDKAMIGEVAEARVGLIDARSDCVFFEALQCLAMLSSPRIL